MEDITEFEISHNNESNTFNSNNDSLEQMIKTVNFTQTLKARHSNIKTVQGSKGILNSFK